MADPYKVPELQSGAQDELETLPFVKRWYSEEILCRDEFEKLGKEAGISATSSNLVDPKEFATIARDLFKRGQVETAGGRVSLEKLKELVEDHSIKGKEAQVLSALYRVTKENRGYFFFRNSTAKSTIDDLVNLFPLHLDLLQLGREIAHTGRQAEKFNALDKDGSGSLSVVELSGLINSSQPNYMEKKMLLNKGVAKILRGRPLGKFGSDSELSKEEVEAIGLFMRSSPEFKPARLADCQSVRTSLSQSIVSSKLFGDGDMVERQAVKQGSVGNCVLVGALSTLAAVDGQLIKKLIKDNGDGTYSVRFPSKDKAYTVKASTEAELGIYGLGTPKGFWPAVVEKAFGLMKRDEGTNDPTKPLAEYTDVAGAPDEILYHLTGKKASKVSFGVLKIEAVQDKLDLALNGQQKTPVIGEIYQYLIPTPARTKNGFPAGHAYGIVGFDRSGPDGGTVAIYNPWGLGKGDPKGEVRISLKKFMANFDGFTMVK